MECPNDEAESIFWWICKEIFACTGTIEIVIVIASVIVILILMMIVIVIVIVTVIVILIVIVIVIVGLVEIFIGLCFHQCKWPSSIRIERESILLGINQLTFDEMSFGWFQSVFLHRFKSCEWTPSSSVDQYPQLRLSQHQSRYCQELKTGSWKLKTKKWKMENENW
jgi:hypothetical protein